MLKVKPSIYCFNQEGLEVIGINGITTNLVLKTKAFVNTSNNEVNVEYTVATYAVGGYDAPLFEHIVKHFTIYQEAVDHYNAILEKYGKK